MDYASFWSSSDVKGGRWEIPLEATTAFMEKVFQFLYPKEKIIL